MRGIKNVLQKKIFPVILLNLILAVYVLPVSASNHSHLPYRVLEISSDEWKRDCGAEYSDLVGIYYAEGIGLELAVRVYNRDDTITIWGEIYNYSQGDYLICTELQENGKDTLEDEEYGFTIKRENSEELKVDFSEECIQKLSEEYKLIYKGKTSVIFTDVRKLVKEPVDDYWGGRYYFRGTWDTDFLETGIYIAQLYGTHDFAVYTNYYDRFGKERGSEFISFYTEQGEILIYELPKGDAVSEETLYDVLSQDMEGDLHSYDYPLSEEELNDLPKESQIYYYY